MHSTRLYLLAAGIGASTFLAALLFQYVGGLPPCQLCIWQRYGLAVGIAGALLATMTRGGARILFGTIGALGFLAEMGVAIYHTGVERQWWKGPETCSGGSLSTTFDPAKLAEATATKPPPACNEIPWDLFGLSMANYNVAIAGFMALLCVMAIRSARGTMNAGQ